MTNTEIRREIDDRSHRPMWVVYSATGQCLGGYRTRSDAEAFVARASVVEGSKSWGESLRMRAERRG